MVTRSWGQGRGIDLPAVIRSGEGAMGTRLGKMERCWSKVQTFCNEINVPGVQYGDYS